MTDAAPPPTPPFLRQPSGPPPGPVADLPIFETIGAAFRSVLVDNIRMLPRAALSPVVLSLLILLLQVRFGFTEVQVEDGTMVANTTSNVLLSLASMVPYVIFAVAWHRLILLGPEAGRPSLVPTWRTRHWLFLIYMIAIGLIAGLFFMIVAFGGTLAGALIVGPGETRNPDGGFGGIFVVAAILVLIVAGWLLSRLCFVLPARALDERYGLRDSWRQTRGQGLRILVTLILVNLIILLPSIAVGGLLGAGSGGVVAINELAQAHFLEAVILFVGLLPFLLLGFLASYLATALGVTVLSIAFRTCSGWTPGGGRATTNSTDARMES